MCWLCDKYGHLARYCRLMRPYNDDYHMYNVERRLEPREEMLWEGTRVYGFVTCSFAKPARPTGIVVGRYKIVWGCDLQLCKTCQANRKCCGKVQECMDL